MRCMKFIFVWVILAARSGWSQEVITISTEDTLTLDRCIEIALKNQPALGAAQGAIITAESDYTQVRSLRFPQIQMEAGAYVTNTPLGSSNAIAQAPVIEPKNNTDFIPTIRLTVKQPIYDFGRTDKSLESKSKLIRAAEMSLQATEDDVILNVHTSYYNYVLAQQILKINEERVTQSRKHLERARGFFAVGKIPESEVYKAELEVSNAELELTNARGKLQLAKVSLNSAMGVADWTDDVTSYKVASHENYVAFNANLRESINSAFTGRREVAASEMRVQAWRSALSAAKSQYYPIITASGGFGPYIVRNTLTTGETKDKFKIGYNIGVNFEFPIFQGLNVRADISEAQGGIRIASSQYNTTKQRIAQEVQERYYSVKFAEERYKSTERIVTQTERNLNLAEGRFDTGVGSAIEVTDANFSVANARIERTTALYNYKIELARFQRTIGTLRK
ncbi:TolC family protein [bacterium]|nr:TolC family protein [bacterium]HMV25482.1 TolC family protein [bacterium]HNB09619.1 TolC family protein [bacterium]HNC47623.1 TolC family protein [bacterium]HNE83428.1 TolC family protein [bacterium]